MGVVNVTPDSSSDGGLYLDPVRAVEHGLRLVEEGADLLDIGGESSRPGSEPVSDDLQRERVCPVIAGIRARSSVPISVDTTRVEVAVAAFRAGADLVNDIRALRECPEIAKWVAAEQGGLILMHMRGTPQTMQTDTGYRDLIEETRDFLAERAGFARSEGVPPERIWIDPGVGFGKSVEGNLDILRNLTRYDALGYPVVVGVSRKSFLGNILAREVGERLHGTLAATAWIASQGVHRIHRVHDTAPVRDCLRIVEAIRGG